MPRQFDSPWKDALDEFLEFALALFHPSLWEAINWSRGYETLDTELSEIVREAEMGPTIADRLFRVRLHTGESVQLLIHVEVQSQYDADIARRMYVYNYRLHDRYNEPVVSMAILGDDNPHWKPGKYNNIVFETATSFEYRVVKLIEYRNEVPQLMVGPNPVGIILAAHLQSLWTNGKDNERKDAKFALIRALFDRGWDGLRIRRMYRLIDWLLELPDELQIALRTEIQQFEEDRKMPYVVSDERIARSDGIKQGLSQGLSQGISIGMLTGLTAMLRMKYGKASQELSTELKSLDLSVEQLQSLLEKIETSTTIDEIRSFIPQ